MWFQSFKPRLLGGFAAVAVLALSACGGGGGDDDNGLEYRGRAQAAAINEASAIAFVSEIMVASDKGVYLPESEDEDDALASLATAFLPLRITGVINPKAEIAASDTYACEGGGSVIVTETANDWSADFRRCVPDEEESLQLSGVVTFTENGDTWAYAFHNLDMRTDEERFLSEGSFRVEISGSETQLTLNLVVKDYAQDIVTKVENMVFTEVVNQDDTFEQTISGRFYHSRHGYVILSMPEAFFYEDDDALYPSAGTLVMTGAGGNTITVAALSAETVQISYETHGGGCSSTHDWVDIEEGLESLCP